MFMPPTMNLTEIESRVSDLVSDVTNVSRHKVFPESRLVQDLGCDSLDFIDVLYRIEMTFDVTLPHDSTCNVYKTVFCRNPFRISDLSEMVYLKLGSGRTVRTGKNRVEPALPSPYEIPFSQLSGVWKPQTKNLFELVDDTGPASQYRRFSDGMRCVRIPAATVEIGSDDGRAEADEKPMHVVQMDSFLIDTEPVSTTAYCRFLNSVGLPGVDAHAEWFILDPEDDRNEQSVLVCTNGQWKPANGTGRFPVVLISWYGANAYSLWANGRDWRDYRRDCESNCFLPSEAQWEYAARGTKYQTYPWGSEKPTPERMVYDRHNRGDVYRSDTMPMAAVNDPLGVSSFGLYHMTGNVWQWCRDWYWDSFYRNPQATESNPVNRTETGVRSERGGSWVGPAELCRSSYRRGRDPLARGRCLGFRCVSLPQDLP